MPWTGNRVADTILREMEAHRKRLGGQLLALRKAKGWNQEDASHAVGVGVKTWRLWERGKTLPYDSNIRRIADVFEIDPDELGQPPAPLGLVPDQPEVEDSLARFAAAIEKQNELLARQSQILERIEGMLGKDEQTADRIEDASESLDGAAAQLDAAVRQAIQGLQASTRRSPKAAAKTAPSRSRRASS